MLLLKSRACARSAKLLGGLTIAMVTLSPFILSSIDAHAKQIHREIRLQDLDDKKPPVKELPPLPPAAVATTNSAIDAASTVAPQPPAPPVVMVVPGTYRSVPEKEMGRFVSKLKISAEKNADGVTQLKFHGQVSESCLPHLRIEVDPPSQDDAVEAAAIVRFEFADIIDKDSRKVLKSAAEACQQKETNSCTRDTCKSITNVLGVVGAQGVELNNSGKIVMKIDNRELPEGHPDAITYRDIPAQYGGPLEFKTEAQLRAEDKARREAEKAEMLASACEDAKKGDREGIALLRKLLGRKAEAANMKKLFEKLELNADEMELKQLEQKIARTSEFKDLYDLIDEVEQFGKDHENLKAKAKILAISLAGRINDLDTDDDRMFHAKLLASEKALKTAKKLDPKDKALRGAIYEAQLERYKWAAGTGSDRFYSASTQREAIQTREKVMNWAQQSNDPQARSIAKSYAKEMQDALVPYGQPNPYGGPPSYYLFPGTKLDEKFARKSMEAEMNDFRRGLINGGGNDKISGSVGGTGTGTNNSLFGS